MHRNKNIEQVKDFKGSILKTIKFNKKYLPLIIIALIFSFASSVLSIIGPDKLKEITNLITSGISSSIDLKQIKEVGIILSLFYAFSFIFNYTQGYIMAIVTNKYSKNMRKSIQHYHYHFLIIQQLEIFYLE